MSWLPKSPKARRRLWVVAAVAPVLAVAVGLSLYAMRDNVTFFFSPSEATAETAPVGRVIRLGGLVETGSVVRGADGEVAFAITDNAATTRIVYHGDLPDLFREGQALSPRAASSRTGRSAPPRCWPSTMRTTCRARLRNDSRPRASGGPRAARLPRERRRRDR